MEDKKKVNKITVSVDEFGANISLYKTNVKYGELTNTDINVPNFDSSGLPNKMVYSQYCKDVVINLLQNDGIEGFYYEEKQQVEGSQKYDLADFIKNTYEALGNILSDMTNGKHITYEIKSNPNVSNDTCTDISERYKDGNIKNGMAKFDIVLAKEDKRIDVTVQMFIKSGQMCRPKVMLFNSDEMSFNITTIQSLLRN